jgi:hypothetical protein
MKKTVNNKIKISYVYMQSDVSDFRLQKALEMLINEEDIKKICKKKK